MKLEITVSKSELLRQMKAAAKVINPSSKLIPAHSNFLLEIGSEFTVTGADSAGNITATIDCSYSEPAEKIVLMADAKTLLDGLKELPEQPLTIYLNSEKDGMEIFHSSGKYHIGTNADCSGFATLKMDSTVSTLVKFDTEQFIEGIKSVHNFAGVDELRPMVTAIYIGSKNYNLTFCATDSSSMALLDKETSLDTPDFEMALPQKAAKSLIDLAKDGELEIEIGPKNVAFYFSGYKIIYRLIEGRYFNFRSIIPTNNNKKFRVSKDSICGSLRRVSVFANKNSSLVELIITESQLKMTGKDVDIDQLAEEVVPGIFNESEALAIGFKAGLLQKCLEAIETEEIVMSFSDATRACLIRPDDVNIAKTVLIMPMLINV